MTIAYDHHDARRRWYQQYHLQRLWARRDRVFRVHFWQAAIAGCLLFWAAVAYGIHSL